MYKTHTTKEGEKMYISQMSDQHLELTIRGHLDAIEAAKSVDKIHLLANKIQRSMYKISDEKLAANAEGVIQTRTNILYPYMAEALLRGGLGLSERIQEVFERKGAEEKFPFGIMNSNACLEFDEDFGLDIPATRPRGRR